MSKKILVIGGDARIDRLSALMAADGLDVEIYTDDIPLKTALKDADVIILGLPASTDGETVNAPKLLRPILMNDLLRLLRPDQLLLGGKFGEKTKAALKVYGVKYIDYLAREEFEIANSVPSAEGAIQIALEEVPITLKNASVIVTGYGKIGKYLSRLLMAFGARVTVFARKKSDLAYARTNGLTALPYKHLPLAAKNAHIIFNTVPAKVIDKEALNAFRGGLIIDLAARGADQGEAEACEVRVIKALGLPGKVAPITAGEILKETVYNILSETEGLKWT